MAGISCCKHTLENSRVYYFIKEQSLKESVCQLGMCNEERSRLVWVGNDKCLKLRKDFYQLCGVHCSERLANHIQS